jgi:hypothetical protein
MVRRSPLSAEAKLMLSEIEDRRKAKAEAVSPSYSLRSEVTPPRCRLTVKPHWTPSKPGNGNRPHHQPLLS